MPLHFVIRHNQANNIIVQDLIGRIRTDLAVLDVQAETVPEGTRVAILFWNPNNTTLADASLDREIRMFGPTATPDLTLDILASRRAAGLPASSGGSWDESAIGRTLDSLYRRGAMARESLIRMFGGWPVHPAQTHTSSPETWRNPWEGTGAFPRPGGIRPNVDFQAQARIPFLPATDDETSFRTQVVGEFREPEEPADNVEAPLSNRPTHRPPLSEILRMARATPRREPVTRSAPLSPEDVRALGLDRFGVNPAGPPEGTLGIDEDPEDRMPLGWDTAEPPLIGIDVGLPLDGMARTEPPPGDGGDIVLRAGGGNIDLRANNVGPPMDEDARHWEQVIYDGMGIPNAFRPPHLRRHEGPVEADPPMTLWDRILDDD